MHKTMINQVALAGPLTLAASMVTGLFMNGPVLAGPVAADLTERDGRVVVQPPEHDPATMNQPWPGEMTDAFWTRANYSIERYTSFKAVTTGEHEKWNYPTAMWCYLHGQHRPVIDFFEALDGEQGWTDGVDLYWCFTLKGQARKWFFFNDELSDGYKDRMRGAMSKWTTDDPRPTLELVLLTGSDVPAVREYALAMLHEMKVPAATVQQWADETEKINPDFAAHARRVAATPGYDDDPGDDPAKWAAWWKLWADGDWKVFEEYERLANPHPHPQHGTGTGPVGTSWGPGVRGTRADARNTDNLRSMRETTVYLFAEEVGNEKVRQLYKEKLRRFTVGLYHVGMGEWDSETYHPHSIMPWLTLYDYAKDPEVKLLAKATLDWLHTAHALKYFRGSFTGPSCRDYGGATTAYAGPAAGYGALLYGAPKDHKADYDDVHIVLSGYRPPLAVANLALKKLQQPIELRNTKPTYSHWLPGAADEPRYFETMTLGRHYTLGSAVTKSSGGDVSPMKLAAARPDGVWFFTANSGKWYNRLEPGDQRGQHNNLLVHVRKGDDKPFTFQVPRDAKQVKADGYWFLDLGDVWLAVKPLGLDLGDPEPITGRQAKNYSDYHTVTAQQTGTPLGGYTLEVGEKGAHASFDAFRKAVASKSKVTIDGDTVTLVGSTGKTLAVTRNDANNLPAVVRDAEPRDFSSEFDLYDAGDAAEGVWLGWNEGELTVKAGGASFTSTVDASGNVTFSEGP